MLGIGLLVKEQLAPNGSPDPQASETDPGNPAPVGVTTALKLATPPAITVAAEGGAMLTEKSLTVAEPLIGEVVPPGKLSAALLPSESGPESTVVGAVTVTVTCAAGLIVVVVVPPEVVDVVGEVFTVPSVQFSGPVVTALPQVP